MISSRKSNDGADRSRIGRDVLFAGAVAVWAVCAVLGPGQAYAGTASKDDANRLGRLVSDIIGAAGISCGKSGMPAPATLAEFDAGPDRAIAIKDHGCRIPVKISGQGGVHASTNGKRIKMTRGMVRFLDRGDELAFVLAHEAAHIILDHRHTYKGRDLREVESEADRLGLLLLVRAGYDREAPIRFLRRLSDTYPELNKPHAAYHSPAARIKAFRALSANMEAPAAQFAATSP